MAQMNPAREHTEFPDGDRGVEELVFDALEAYLPEDYLVFHSVDWVRGANETFDDRMQGEMDFLVFDPQGRSLVIEVKSGTLGYDQNEDQWYRIDHHRRKPEDSNPLEQVRSARKKLLGVLEDNEYIGGVGRYPGLVGQALCFPNMNRADVQDLNDLMMPDERLLLFDDLQEGALEDRLEELFEMTREELPFVPDGLSSDERRRVKDQVLPTSFGIPRSLRNKLGMSSKAVHRLTDEQKQFLQFMNGAREAFIKGYAGSGKTFLSLEQAKWMAADGKEVLWLCYNKILAEKLSDRYDTEGVNVSHYHEFARLFCEEHGVNIFDHQTGDETDFWQNTVPELFLETAEASNRTYDAIVLDEAQDFLGSYVIGLRELLDEEEGQFYVFYDPQQNVFHDELPEWLVEREDEARLLPNNVRNTEQISRASAALGDIEYADHVSDLGPPGPPVRVSTVSDRQAVHDRLRKAFHEVFHEEGVDPERAVVLGYHRFENTQFGDEPELGNYRLVDMKSRYEERAEMEGMTEDDPVERGPMEVPYYTIHSFKGLDRDIVFLVNPEAGEKEVLDYAGASRARHLLWVMTADPGIEQTVKAQLADEDYAL